MASIRLQRGLSLGSMMFWAVLIGVSLILGFKLVPVYNEFFAIKHAIQAIAKEQNGAMIPQMRDSFNKRAQIDSISAIAGDSLDIEQTKDVTTIHVEYSKVVPLFSNVSLKFDFKADASSGASQ